MTSTCSRNRNNTHTHRRGRAEENGTLFSGGGERGEIARIKWDTNYDNPPPLSLSQECVRSVRAATVLLSHFFANLKKNAIFHCHFLKWDGRCQKKENCNSDHFPPSPSKWQHLWQRCQKRDERGLEKRKLHLLRDLPQKFPLNKRLEWSRPTAISRGKNPQGSLLLPWLL